MRANERACVRACMRPCVHVCNISRLSLSHSRYLPPVALKKRHPGHSESQETERQSKKD